MNTTQPPSDPSGEPDFNGFGSYRRKRKTRDTEETAPRRSFRRIPRDEFPGDGASAGFPDEAAGGEEAAPRHPFHGKKPFGKKPFGKKPFGKKPFGKKPFGKKKPYDHGEPRFEQPDFRDFADTIDEGEVPPPRRDRSFKKAAGDPRGVDGGFRSPRKPFGGKPFGRKPFRKFRPHPAESPFDGEAEDGYPRPPRALRRPYGAPADGTDSDEAFREPRKPFRKPFGKKPFGGKKPFHARKPFAASSSDMVPDEGPAPYGKKPFGGKIRADEIGLRARESGLVLPCGSTAIWEK